MIYFKYNHEKNGKNYCNLIIAVVKKRVKTWIACQIMAIFHLILSTLAPLTILSLLLAVHLCLLSLAKYRCDKQDLICRLFWPQQLDSRDKFVNFPIRTQWKFYAIEKDLKV